MLQQQLLRLKQFYYDYKYSYRNTQDLNEAIRFIHEDVRRDKARRLLADTEAYGIPRADAPQASES
ncbi:hypothetical protein [Paenibacillus sp. MMO-58]|uniref:hypothetical protein n=1 Tax=Paenibacillus sp. MMO-58 TaxID=3081290 RepID=UPI00301A9015